jgi:ABC-2 type transport system permease protein
VFYSISLLPEAAQQISRLNPILWLQNARYGILGVSDVPIGIAWLMMTVCLAVLFGACVMMLNRGYRIRE